MRLTAGRVAAGLAWGAWIGAVSYPLQRLYSALSGEIPYASILAQEHIPYYWRVVLAGFHAVVVGLIVAMGSTDDQARRSLQAIPAAIAVLLGLALLMVVYP